MQIQYFTCIAFIAFLCGVNNTFAAETQTLVLTPTFDGTAQLYDQDGLTDWDTARNYTGELFNEPVTDDELISLRSDSHSGYYRIYRSSMSFDASALPNDAEIISATLYLYNYSPVINISGTDVVVTFHSPVTEESLVREDWQIQNFSSEIARRQLIDGDYTALILNQLGLDGIDFDGVTTFGLMTEFDYDNNPIGPQITGVAIYSKESGLSPYLEITYTVPEDEVSIEEQLEAIAAAVGALPEDALQRSLDAHSKKLVRFYEAGLVGDVRDQLAALERKVARALSRGEIEVEAGSDLLDLIGAVAEQL